MPLNDCQMKYTLKHNVKLEGVVDNIKTMIFCLVNLYPKMSFLLVEKTVISTISK